MNLKHQSSLSSSPSDSSVVCCHPGKHPTAPSSNRFNYVGQRKKKKHHPWQKKILKILQISLLYFLYCQETELSIFPSFYLQLQVKTPIQSSNNWPFGGTAISPAISALHLGWLNSAPGQLQNSGKQSFTYDVTFSYQSLTSPQSTQVIQHAYQKTPWSS